MYLVQVISVWKEGIAYSCTSQITSYAVLNVMSKHFNVDYIFITVHIGPIWKGKTLLNSKERQCRQPGLVHWLQSDWTGRQKVVEILKKENRKELVKNSATFCAYYKMNWTVLMWMNPPLHGVAFKFIIVTLLTHVVRKYKWRYSCRTKACSATRWLV